MNPIYTVITTLPLSYSKRLPNFKSQLSKQVIKKKLKLENFSNTRIYGKFRQSLLCAARSVQLQNASTGPKPTKENQKPSGSSKITRSNDKINMYLIFYQRAYTNNKARKRAPNAKKAQSAPTKHSTNYEKHAYMKIISIYTILQHNNYMCLHSKGNKTTNATINQLSSNKSITNHYKFTSH